MTMRTELRATDERRSYLPSRAFTIVELLVTLGIMAALAAMTVFAMGPLQDRSAVNGGAIYNQNNVLTIQSSTLFGDTATNDGGCVDNQDTLFAANATFTENSAGVQGGAIYNNDMAKIVNCTIDGNEAGSGGGIATNSLAIDATLNNTIVSQNKLPDKVRQESKGHCAKQ